MKEVLIRAVRTFIQAAVGFIAANVVVYLSGMDGSSRAVKSAVAALITAAIASGLAAVMNMSALKSAKTPDGEGEAQLGKADGEVTEAADKATKAEGGDEPETADGEQVKRASDTVEEATEAEVKNPPQTADGEQYKRALPDNDETEEKNE